MKNVGWTQTTFWSHDLFLSGVLYSLRNSRWRPPPFSFWKYWDFGHAICTGVSWCCRMRLGAIWHHQSTAASCAACRLPSNWSGGRSQWCMTLSGCRHSHAFHSSVRPNFFRHVLASQTVVLSTNEEFITVADCQSSSHRLDTSLPQDPSGVAF